VASSLEVASKRIAYRSDGPGLGPLQYLAPDKGHQGASASAGALFGFSGA